MRSFADSQSERECCPKDADRLPILFPLPCHFGCIPHFATRGARCGLRIEKSRWFKGSKIHRWIGGSLDQTKGGFAEKGRE
jgi:hypothetical protein